MLLNLVQKESGARRRYAVQFAHTMSEVIEAQRLRYRVFVEEMGARPVTSQPGIDRDIFDAFCEHLLVRDGDSNEVVGTYRILNSAQAKKLGGFYSESEFDLVRLRHLRPNMVEVGRSCVHPDYRDGTAISLLWSGLAGYLHNNGCEYLIGCVSISMADGGHHAASVYRKIRREHLSPVEYRVFPRHALPLNALNGELDASLPPLIKGYLRLGAYVCGEPAWNPDFNSADLLMLLPVSRIRDRHFMKAA
ncbi:MAG: GNAT family N-acyltransferase [Pseudomonadota bacterium]